MAECPSCFEEYNETRKVCLLPCLHKICKECFNDSVNISSFNCITCKEAYVMQDVLEENNFLNEKKTKLTLNSTSVKPKKIINKDICCNIHKCNSLSLFCEDCSKVVCISCVLKKHYKHNIISYFCLLSNLLNEVELKFNKLINFKELLINKKNILESNVKIIFLLQDFLIKNTREIHNNVIKKIKSRSLFNKIFHRKENNDKINRIKDVMTTTIDHTIKFCVENYQNYINELDKVNDILNGINLLIDIKINNIDNVDNIRKIINKKKTKLTPEIIKLYDEIKIILSDVNSFNNDIISKFNYNDHTHEIYVSLCIIYDSEISGFEIDKDWGPQIQKIVKKETFSKNDFKVDNSGLFVTGFKNNTYIFCTKSYMENKLIIN